ncbi:MAG: hypothetical protein D3904_14855 [Candidatus Electrothrix sp. EH2]|nr:hypothetical protein [Candidatus Electrothrix sp. EH2]
MNSFCSLTYVLRPLLAICYIEAGKGLPPVEFEQLVEAVSPPEIRQGIAYRPSSGDETA